LFLFALWFFFLNYFITSIVVLNFILYLLFFRFIFTILIYLFLFLVIFNLLNLIFGYIFNWLNWYLFGLRLRYGLWNDGWLAVGDVNVTLRGR
jgi:hypothetical protein